MTGCDVNMSVQIIKSVFHLFFLLLSLNSVSYGRIHNLKLQNDNRNRMTLSTFGFLKGGTLAVNITLFSYRKTLQTEINNHTFGFTLDKSKSAGFSSYVESVAGPCIWDKQEKKSLESVFFKFDLKNKRINIERTSEDLAHLMITDQVREQYLFDKYLDHGVNLKGLEEEAAKAKAEAKKQNKKTTLPVGANDKGAKSDGDVKSRKARAADDDEAAGSPTGKLQTTSKPPTPEAKAPTAPLPAATKSQKAATLPASGDEVTEKPPPKAAISDGTDNKNDKDKDASNAKKKTDKPQPATTAAPLVTSVPMTETRVGSVSYYEAYFLMHVRSLNEEGLYNLFFHNCLNVDSLINLTLQIIEDNNGNYLSADEMPIPALYFVFSVVFLVLLFTWISVLRSAEEGVYKIHYLMLLVVFFKSLSCLFHGVNMYMIQKNGIHVDAWAILWYIVYLTRGALMFVTVLLIGAGWAFIKHMFSDREKKLFLIVMPLQILENVAWVIVEESEEGTSSYNTWNKIFMAVDIICCIAIIFPVMWSIKHLQEASRTDGKAALNLNKLKLFKFFYIMVVCYVYFSRFIVYLLKIILPFHYGWMRNLFAEVFLLCFFTLTGYKFRPTSDNPYLQVPMDSDEEDIEMDEVMTKTGNMETLSRVNQHRGEEDQPQVQTQTTMKQRESSHEYD